MDSEVLYEHRLDALWDKGVGFPFLINFKDNDSYNTFTQSFLGHCPVCGKNTVIIKASRKEVLEMAGIEKKKKEREASGFDDFRVINPSEEYQRWKNGCYDKIIKNGFVCEHCGNDYRPAHGGIMLGSDAEISRSQSSRPDHLMLVSKAVVAKDGNKIIVNMNVDHLLLKNLHVKFISRSYHYCSFNLETGRIYISVPGYKKIDENGKPSLSLKKGFMTYSPFAAYNSYSRESFILKHFVNFYNSNEAQKFINILENALKLAPYIQLEGYEYDSPTLTGGKRRESIFDRFFFRNINACDIHYAKSIYHCMVRSVNSAFNGYYDPEGKVANEFVATGVINYWGEKIFKSRLARLKSVLKSKSTCEVFKYFLEPDNLVFAKYSNNQNRLDMLSCFRDLKITRETTAKEKAYYNILCNKLSSGYKDEASYEAFEKRLQKQKSFKLYNKYTMLEMIA